MRFGAFSAESSGISLVSRQFTLYGEYVYCVSAEFPAIMGYSG